MTTATGVPTAAYTYSPFIVYPNTIVQFTDESADPIPVAWLWDFGDGSYSTLQNPTHAFATPGDYTVMLTVWGTVYDYDNGVNGQNAYGTIYVENYASGTVIPAFVVTSVDVNPPTLSVGDYAQLTATVQNTSTVAGAAKIAFTDGQSGPWIVTTTTPVISPGMTGQNQPSEAVVQATTEGSMTICAYIVASGTSIVLPVGPYTNQQNYTTSAGSTTTTTSGSSPATTPKVTLCGQVNGSSIDLAQMTIQGVDPLIKVNDYNVITDPQPGDTVLIEATMMNDTGTFVKSATINITANGETIYSTTVQCNWGGFSYLNFCTEYTFGSTFPVAFCANATNVVIGNVGGNCPGGCPDNYG
jgi:PKD repeat protein